MTLLEFSNVFAVLAVQLRQTDADDTTIRGYYAVLKDYDLEFLQMAAARLAHQSTWFPKTSEWREMVATVIAERRELQRRLMRQSPVPLCTLCNDTGWCEPTPGAPVRPCACREDRRLELLGRRPFPTLTEGAPAPDPNVPRDTPRGTPHRSTA